MSAKSLANRSIRIARRLLTIANEVRHQFNCLVLERRATENYFTEAAIRRVKGEKYRALAPYEKVADVPLGWQKSENWRIAREMTLADLEGTDLLPFLQSL